MKAPSVYSKVSKEYPRKIAMRLEALTESKKSVSVSKKTTDRRK